MAGYHLTSVNQVPGTPANKPLFDYVYTVDVHNGGSLPGRVTATAEKRGNSFTLQDPDAAYGIVMPGETKTSTDTITLRANKHFDRSLDARLQKNGVWRFDDASVEEEDNGPGAVLGSIIGDLTDAAVKRYYDAKLNASLQWTMVVRFDVVAPGISNLLPQGNVNSAIPTISASYADHAGGSGVDLKTVLLKLDGVDVSAQAVKTAAGINYRPAQALAQGAHTADLSLADIAGNPAAASWTFTVDSLGPAIANAQPANGATLPADAVPAIGAQFEDAGAGIDPATLQLQVDGQNVTPQAQVTATGISFIPTQALPEGEHTARLALADRLGSPSVLVWTFKTATPPLITAQRPIDILLGGGSLPTIGASFSDVGAGIDGSKARLQLNGADVTAQATITAAGIAYTVPAALTDGTYTVDLAIADKAGNQAASRWSFGVVTPPTIGALAPKDLTLPPDSMPVVSAQFSDALGAIDVASIKLLLDGEDVTARSQVSVSGISYTPAAALAAGVHTVYLEVANKSNAVAQAVWGFEVDSPTTYQVTITGPADNTTSPQARIAVTASASSDKTYPTGLTVNGNDMLADSTGGSAGFNFAGNVDLADGVNMLTVLATYANGQTRSAVSHVTYHAPPRITIASPADKTTFGAVNPNSPRDLTGKVERPVLITGSTSKPVQTVTINQQAATLSAGGTEFSFENFFLHEGINLLSAVATDPYGNTASASVTVAVDQTAPLLSIEAPATDALTSSAAVDVRGVVNDAIEGWIDAPYPVVTVTNGANGRSASAKVGDRFYIVEDVALEVGSNLLTISAVDHVGNRRSQQLNVTRIGAGSNRLTLLSGNRQRGALSTPVPKPLAIVALAKDGNPLANVAIAFDVLRGTGSISATPGANPAGEAPARNLTARTDDAGRAQVWLTLGKQSGEAGNTVRASNPAIGEEVVFTASGEKGLPAFIRADGGVSQYGETSASALEPVSAIVTDADENRLANTVVVFSIEAGDAAFVDAGGAPASSASVTTDKNGLAAVRPMFGAQPGLVRISAKAINPVNQAEVQGASYQLNVLPQQDGPTRFSGKVLSHNGEPLPGVRMSIGRTALSTTTDDTGYFTFDGQVPPGKLDLFIDGRTANVQTNQYPALHFEALAVRGQNNVLPHAIYLPPLLMSEAKVVGGDQDVTLHIPGFEGFEMVVKANSVTFPDGSKIGPLVVSPVQQDKLPMVPPGGYNGFMAPAWTIQPSGTRFDPPLQVKVPNSLGLKPGETREIYQWDHDLATFAPMGRATVSEDGALLVSDANSGVTKAGWGGPPNPPPDPPKCAPNSSTCPDCQMSDAGTCPKCVWDPASVGNIIRTSIGAQWDMTFMKDDASRIFTKLKLPKAQAKAKGSIQIARSRSCCVRTSRKEKVDLTSGIGEIELSAEGGPIGGFGISADGLEIGVYVKLKAAGAVNIASYKKDFCKIDEAMNFRGSASVALTGELSAKATVVGVPYGMDFTGGVTGGKTWRFDNPTTSYLSASLYGKAEVVFASRKYQLINFSYTWADERTFSVEEAGADIESAIGAAQ